MLCYLAFICLLYLLCHCILNALVMTVHILHFFVFVSFYPHNRGENPFTMSLSKG